MEARLKQMIAERERQLEQRSEELAGTCTTRVALSFKARLRLSLVVVTTTSPTHTNREP